MIKCVAQTACLGHLINALQTQCSKVKRPELSSCISLSVHEPEVRKSVVRKWKYIMRWVACWPVTSVRLGQNVHHDLINRLVQNLQQSTEPDVSTLNSFTDRIFHWQTSHQRPDKGQASGRGENQTNLFHLFGKDVLQLLLGLTQTNHTTARVHQLNKQ